MRIGVLTGGGDCPGLNAVIRAVVRTCDVRYGSSVVGFQDGWRGLLEDRRIQLAQRRPQRPAARQGRHHARHGAGQPRQAAGRAGPDQADARRQRHRRADPDRRRGHADRGALAVRGERPGRRRAEDHRQRHRLHRRDVRPRHRAARGHRGHRPAAQHRRVASAGDARRGDGPPRRLDRAERRAGLGCAHDADPRAALRRRRGVPAGQAALRARRLALHLRGRRGRQAGRGVDAAARRRHRRVRPRAVHRRRPPARRRGREADQEGSAHHGARPRAARRHADRRTTGCWPPGSG